MKQLVAHILTSLFTIVLYVTGSAYAQSPAVIRVNIPFEFSLGDKTFQSGEYSLVQPLQHFLVLRDARGQTIASTFTTGVELSTAPATSKLLFRSVGGQYWLTEVWQQNDTAGLQVKLATPNNRLVANHRSTDAHHTSEGSQP